MNKSILMLIAAIVLWGTTIPPTKWALEVWPPFTVTFLRLILAAVVFAPFVWLQTRRAKSKITIPWLRLAMLSFTGVAGYFMLSSVGINITSGLNASILNASLPLFTLVFASLYLKERIAVSQWFGFLIGVIGVLVITVNPGDGGEESSIVGDILILLSSLVWAIYIVQMKRPQGEAELTSEMFTFLTLLIGGVMLLPAAIGESFVYAQLEFSWRAVMSIVYLALCPTIGAYWLWNKALLNVSGARAGAYLNTLPLVSAVFSIAFLGETVTWRTVVGATLVLVGVFWTEKKPNRQKSILNL